jgi:hypothetical protein
MSKTTNDPSEYPRFEPETSPIQVWSSVAAPTRSLRREGGRGEQENDKGGEEKEKRKYN